MAIAGCAQVSTPTDAATVPNDVGSARDADDAAAPIDAPRDTATDHPATCVATCTSDAQCNASCPGAGPGHVGCCDHDTTRCFVATSSVCPVPVDSGFGSIDAGPAACPLPCVGDGDCSTCTDLSAFGEVACCNHATSECDYRSIFGACPGAP